jgi:hypothetical protein
MKRSIPAGSSPLARAAELGDAALQALARAHAALERALVAMAGPEAGGRPSRRRGRKLKGHGRAARPNPSPE